MEYGFWDPNNIFEHAIIRKNTKSTMKRELLQIYNSGQTTNKIQYWLRIDITLVQEPYTYLFK